MLREIDENVLTDPRESAKETAPKNLLANYMQAAKYVQKRLISLSQVSRTFDLVKSLTIMSQKEIQARYACLHL